MKFQPCDKCKLEKHPYEQYGYYYTDDLKVIECECHIKWRSEARIKYLAKKGNIWEEAFSYNPTKDYYGTKSVETVKRIIKYTEKYIDEVQGFKVRSMPLYIYGAMSTQKTSLAQWVASTILDLGFTVKYVKMAALIKDIVSDFEIEERGKVIESYLSTDLLIVDESFEKNAIGVSKSKYELPYLESFIKERIEDRKKGIIFVSNTKPTDIEVKGFNSSIQNLIVRETEKKGNLLVLEDVIDSFSPNQVF